MPRRSLLSDTERDTLLVLPERQDDLIQQYSFTDADLALIRLRPGRLQSPRLRGPDVLVALPRLCAGQRHRPARSVSVSSAPS